MNIRKKTVSITALGGAAAAALLLSASPIHASSVGEAYVPATLFGVSST